MLAKAFCSCQHSALASSLVASIMQLCQASFFESNKHMPNQFFLSFKVCIVIMHWPKRGGHGGAGAVDHVVEDDERPRQPVQYSVHLRDLGAEEDHGRPARPGWPREDQQMGLAASCQGVYLFVNLLCSFLLTELAVDLFVDLVVDLVVDLLCTFC